MNKKILYSVQTTGLGHITRSFEVINMLKSKGYDIDILVSGQNYLKDFGTEIKHRFQGLSFDAESKIDLRNIYNNNDIKQFIKDIYNLDLSSYDLVITDFEPITSWKGALSGKKVLGIGNHYKFFETRLTLKISFFLNKLLCRLASPVADYIGFDYIKSPNRKILNPIVRESLINSESEYGNYYITYLHNYTEKEQIDFFKKYPTEKFKIYIKDTEDKIVGNVEVISLNKEKFTSDLIKCRGVITNAGFQTTTECLYLGKKIWVIPISNQIEQYYNTTILKELGIICSTKLNSDDFSRLINTDYRIKVYYEPNTLDRVLSKVESHF